MARKDKKLVQRRLQAALFADIVGYSRLMGDDEMATLAAKKQYFNIFKELCREHDGNIEQFMGDGIFIMFDSAVNAVSFAVEVQHAILELNENANFPIVFRIGINLGEVLHDETGVHGDSINIASRLESIAEPGSVCVSGAIYEQVKNKLTFGYECLGTQVLKNIREPIQAFRVQREADGATMIASPRAITQHGSKDRESKPSVVVLPFIDQAGDPSESWFADGITEDITSNLSRFQNLFVISRNSAFLYNPNYG